MDKSVDPTAPSTTIGAIPAATGGTPPYIYSWSPATGLNSTTTNNPTASPTTTTVYTLTVTDSATPTPATATDTVTVTHQILPLVANAGLNKVVSPAAPSATIGGSPAATGGVPPYSYSWSPATGLNSTTTNSPTASPTATTTYTLAVTDSASPMPSTATDTVDVIVATSFITYITNDVSTAGTWRSTNVVKPFDIDGDNAYGTDGYIAGNQTQSISNSSYATLTIVGGTQDGQNGLYINVDKATDPIAGTVGDENAPARYHHPVANLSEHDSVNITLTAARTFRVSILSDIRNDNAIYNSTGFRIRQTVGGVADSGMIPFANNNSGGDWHLFDVTGLAGDQFVLSLRASASAGETAFARLGIDSVVPPPSILQITSVSYNANNDQVTLVWDSVPGATYTVENATELVGNGAGTVWDNLTPNIPSGGIKTTNVVDFPSPGTYYRIRKQ